MGGGRVGGGVLAKRRFAAAERASHSERRKDRLDHVYFVADLLQHQAESGEMLGEYPTNRIDGAQGGQVLDPLHSRLEEARLPLLAGAIVGIAPGFGKVRGARIELDEVPIVRAVILQRRPSQVTRLPFAEEIMPP